MITADRESRVASTAPAGAGLDAGAARPGPGAPASPVPFSPFPAPLREPGWGEEREQHRRGWVGPHHRSNLSRVPSPCKNFHPGKLFAGCLRGQGEGTQLRRERGCDGS